MTNSGTTTIQITNEQKAELDSLKEHSGEPYKSVLQRLITHYKANTPEGMEMDEERVRSIATDVFNERMEE